MTPHVPAVPSAGGDPVRLSIQTCSVEDTESVGRALGQGLRAGDVLLLEGELGAGKTHLVRGLAEGLHLDSAQVCSPTFVLMNEYRAIGSPSLVHVDAYRLSGGDDLDAIGFDAALARPCVVAVEWASRLGDRIGRFDRGRTVVLSLSHTGEEERHISIDLPAAVARRPGMNGLLRRAGEKCATTCPMTGLPVPAESPTWPFSSEQARLVDLHRWLSGGYAVSRELTPDDEE